MSHTSKSHLLFRSLVIVAVIVGVVSNAFVFQPVYAAANLTVEIIAAPNLIVDSNVLSPSTAQPIVATVIGKFCNTGGSTLNNVVGYIGDYTGFGPVYGTPGDYPDHTPGTLGSPPDSTTYDGTYQFQHLGSLADATRYIGALAAGQCSYQYWSLIYPKYANWSGGTNNIPAWGTSVKPDDDLFLYFDIWGNYPGQTPTFATHKMTMRNEIAAMANKIEPNGNPAGAWFNTDTSTILPGETVTTNGILYRLGNIRQGFDNDGNGVPDYNAWMQPFGDPAYDPDCFRLIETSGVLTVTTSTGDVIVPFKDSLYFTDLPQNNVNAVGLVYYKFLALGGACTIPITPYQEVASGFDNEKFNADYGAGPGPVGSYQPKVTISKSAPGSVNEGATYTYQIPFANTSTTATAGLTISSSGIDMPLVISDTVPAGLEYVCNSAAASLTGSNTATIYFSTDSGATWSTSQPGSCPTNPLSTGNIMLMWKLNNPLPKSPDPGSTGNTASFQARVPVGYIVGGGKPFIENCTDARFGVSGSVFATACAVTMVTGTGQIGDRVWADVNGDGAQTGESGINAITVYLYWDKNNNNLLDSGDVLVSQQDTVGTGVSNYNFTTLPPGEYIVKVAALDPDLPTGYSPTTVEFYAVSLAAGQIYTTADFGFGPALRLSKELATTDPAVVGETVTFQIHLVNTRPGDGTANGFCTYYVWPSATSTDGTANKQFAAIANAIGAPDSLYASAGYGTGGNRWIGGSGYSSGGRTGGITSVKAVMDGYLAAALVDDSLDVSLTGGATAWLYNISTAAMNGTAPGEGKKNTIASTAIPGTAAPGGSWDWNDFNTVGLRLDMNKQAAAESVAAVLNVDAFGFLVTTDDLSCGGGDSTIDPLPLTDTYDSTKLQFLFANPPHSVASTGIITWENLGPLYAGGARLVEVNFKALATTTTATVNTAAVNTARFSSGRAVNSVTDTASVNINTSYSLTGKTWIDAGGTLGWSGTTGYDPIPATDQALPNVKMNLYVCVGANGSPIAQDTNRNTACGAVSTESWKLVGTTYTDNNGNYTFSGLRPGYYNVQANDKNLPAGMIQRDGEASGVANGTGIGGNPCAACDSAWNEQATQVKNLAYLAANTTQVNFGYRNPSLGTVTGYVWYDQDQGGYNDWDPGELPIPGTTVTLLCTGAGCAQPSYTTVVDQNGYYQFSGLNVGPTATYQVIVTPPGGTGQTADPNYPTGSCYGTGNCDNQTNTFTLTAGGSHGPDLFGYYGGLKIGDTVYTDWNGNGSQNTTTEEGIGGVQVLLYLDSNGNNAVDSGEPLLGTRDTLYNVIGGKLDINNDGSITASDDKTLLNGYRIIDGQVDMNNDGSITPADNGTFAGYAVYGGLIDTSGNGSGGAEDNANLLGKYEFTQVPGGSKYIVLVNTAMLPAGYTQTGDPDEPGTCSICDSKDPLQLGSTDYLDADFGYQPRGFSSIGDYVWNDANGDGVQGATEVGINNVTMNLYQDQNGNGVIDTEDALLGTTATGFGVIDGYIDIDRNATVNGSDDSPAVLGVRIIDGKLDIDGNGVVNASDDGEFAGYTVIDGLLDIDGNGVVNTGDDGTLNGLYQFRHLPAGNYIVEVASAEFTSGDLVGYLMTSTGAAYNTTQHSYQLTLGASEDFTSADFGFATTAIGDFIWKDFDGNGLADINEPGINGVVMELYRDMDNSGTLNGGDTLYGTTTTANNSLGAPGYYLFSGMPAGNYIVKVADSNFSGAGMLVNYTLTADPDVYNDTTPSSVSCLTFGAQGCDNLKPYDRYAAGATINGRPVDENPAIRGGSRELTADFGYQPQAYVGDTIWIDSDADGVRDTTELGIRNITVRLCSTAACSGGGDPIATTSTDENGIYSFGGMTNGTYYVVVDITDPDWPAGLTQTYDPVTGNNCNAGTCTTAPSIVVDLTRTAGSVSSIGGNACAANTNCNLNVDFGYRFAGPNTITGTVWNDGDSNKIIGGTESTRYSTVPVYLWRCVGGCGGTDDILVGSTVSASDGTYSFTGLADGTYRVVANSNAYTLRGTSTTTPVSVDTSGTDQPSATLSGGATAVRNFGFLSNMDLGDLPSAYNNTLLANDGARHLLVGAAQVYLGTAPNADPDGKQSPTATGDTDEGVLRTPGVNWAVGPTGGSINVTVGGCTTSCYLSAWFDWNSDTDFTDAGENVLLDQALNNGTTTVTFPIPAGVSFPNTFYSRFRLYASNTSGLARPTGLITNGEVEDYQWPFGPTAITLSTLTARSTTADLLLPLALLTVVLSITLVLLWRRRREA